MGVWTFVKRNMWKGRTMWAGLTPQTVGSKNSGKPQHSAVSYCSRVKSIVWICATHRHRRIEVSKNLCSMDSPNSSSTAWQRALTVPLLYRTCFALFDGRYWVTHHTAETSVLVTTMFLEIYKKFSKGGAFWVTKKCWTQSTNEHTKLARIIDRID